MYNSARKLKVVWDAFGLYKPKAIILFFIILLYAGVEGFGLAMILPLLSSVVDSQTLGFLGRFILEPIQLLIPEKYLFLTLCMLFLGILILKNVFFLIKTAYTSYMLQEFSRHWILSIKKQYFYSPYSFIINHKQGFLLNNLMEEPGRAVGALNGIIDFLANFILACVLYLVLILANWQTTLILSVIFCSVILISNRVSRHYSEKFGKERISVKQSLYSQASENIAAIRQIKTFGLEDGFYNKFADTLSRFVKIVVKFKIIKALPLSVGEILFASVFVLGLIYLQYILNYEFINIIPLLGLFIVVAQRLRGNLTQLVTQRMQIYSMLPSLRLVDTLVKNKSEEIRYQKGETISRINDDILIKDLSFSYNGLAPVFSGLNITIPLGKMTALVGRSGSGKSTLADLILGLYTPQKGAILVNGRELEQINLRSWQQRIGFVSQDTFVFNTTIAENIAIGKLDATEEESYNAAKLAGAHDFIMQLPEQYETVVGDRGLKLSGGQRQRIAIARALIRDPDLLIFDEATSSLDTETEKAVQESIEELSKNKTILVIAHRLSTIENAHVVYDLDKILNR